MKILTVIGKRTRRLLSPAVLWLATRELEPLFYFGHYDDLRGLDSEKLLREHYIRHGRFEGRLPNKASLVRQQYAGGTRAVQPRLRSFFRRLRGTAASRQWESLVSVPQLVAWCGDRVDSPPTTREQAFELFEQRGVDELWPIRFDYSFDAGFYVSAYRVPASSTRSAADAYRHFLTVGLENGYAPNESSFLYRYLGGLPYPEHFDWRSYAAAARIVGRRGRISALKHLFSTRHRDFGALTSHLGEDAFRIMTSIGRYALVRGRYEHAVAALSAAADLQASATVFCLLGDSLQKLGRIDDALIAYQRSIAAGSAPIWPYFHCIDLFCDRKDFEAAFEVLRQAFRPWRDKIDFRHKLDRCIELFFQYQSAQAHEIYRANVDPASSSNSRNSADELLKATLDRIRDLYSELDDLPASTLGQADGYVAILANDGLRQCTHYRIEQKVEQFERAGIPVRVFAHDDVNGFISNLTGARAAIFYRVAAFPNVVRAILHANSMGLTTYYEVDDLIFDPTCYPDPFSSFEGQIDSDEYAGLQFGVPLFRYALAMCQGSIASTAALADNMRRVTTTSLSVILPNGLDSRNDPWIRVGAHHDSDRAKRVRVFYGSGTKAHNADFNDLVAPALVEVMRHFPEIDLVIVGHLKLRAALASLRDRVHVFPFTPHIDAYWSILASCDINLAVLHPGSFADCKSEIKWLEAAILQIPSMLSDTATYRRIVTEGVDGFIASGPQDWRRVLSELAADATLRARIGAAARAHALEAYSLDAGAQVLKLAFDQADGSSPQPVHRKRLRVLICNVFFHPQSHGGATRVVEDNVRSFLALYDDLEIGVLCSDEGVTPAGQLRMGSFSGIPVYRLSTPIEPGMDWRGFNPENASSFDRVIDHFRPDIIHFHCIQRLTASIAEEALRREIPYLVTLHDGWWVSDNQFLVDEDGFLRLPTTDIIDDTRERPAPAQSVERRQLLRPLLQEASAVLSVSSAFARIYEHAGIQNVRVVENGLPELASSARARGRRGRLALGHIGGRSAHKGAFLLEAALRQEQYRNLHLTMVDGTLAPGETVDATWGSTPVTLTGPYPQSEVGALYEQLDVLLAPSTWPESYGLVTREALFHGLWVIASDLGAIGEGIHNGRNGYVIDTRTTAALKEILHELDDRHERYKQAPAAADAPLRAIEEQARELHTIYWEIARDAGQAPTCDQHHRAA